MEIQGVLDYFGTMKLILVSSHPPHTISMWKSVRLTTDITGDSLGFMGPQLLVAEALSGLCYVDLPMPVPCHGCVQANVTYLKSCKFDHIPIMLEVTPGSTRRIHRLFQFEEIWTHHEEYEEIIREAWATSVVDVPMYQVCEKIKTTRMTLNTWHHKTFKARQAEIEVIHDKITSIDSLPYTNTAMDERSEFIHQLDSFLLEKESHWKLRSRIQWMKAGDRNTHFFHQRANLET
ncbi:hypothetical protein ACFX13_019619 [Malus domestica]